MTHVNDMTLDELRIDHARVSRECDWVSRQRDWYSNELVQQTAKVDAIWLACQQALSDGDIEIDNPLIVALVNLGLQVTKQIKVQIAFSGYVDTTVIAPVHLDNDDIMDTIKDWVDIDVKLNPSEFTDDGHAYEIFGRDANHIDIDDIAERNG